MSEESRAIQDLYPSDVAHCFGCGRDNAHGHRLKTRPHGDGTVSRFRPEPYHCAIPGYVYGGLIASLIDCSGTGTAAWAARESPGAVPRFVTGKLEVSYLKPTPLGPELELRARVREKTGKKVVVEVDVVAAGSVTATGVVTCIRMPESMTPR